jgi:signal transduction histidine kinase
MASPEGIAIAVILGLATAATFLWAATLSRHLFKRDGMVSEACFAVGLVFAAFGQLSLIFYPETDTGLITNGEMLRLAFIVMLLLGVEADAQATLSTLRQANLSLAQLKDAEVHRAALNERARLSRELHDGLAQSLWLAKLKAGRLAAVSDLGPDASRLWTEVVSAIDAGLGEARQAVLALRVDGDSESSFESLLLRSLDDFEDRFGLRTEFECPSALPRLPMRTEAEVLRIAQEALNNVARHADATVVRVRAAADEGQLAVSIRDNGRGFDMSQPTPGHVGLESMRERAALVGGTVRIESQPLDGTHIWVAVPIASDRAAMPRMAP